MIAGLRSWYLKVYLVILTASQLTATFLDNISFLEYNQVMITKVTGKNQITIPAKLARQLGIQPGQRIDWSIEEDGVLTARLLPSRSELARQAAGMGRQWLETDMDPIADLIEERENADKEEDLE
jgi:AbrB family looped-hinge helix DNA binding protein